MRKTVVVFVCAWCASVFLAQDADGRQGTDRRNLPTFRTGAPGRLQRLPLPKPARLKIPDGKTGWKMKLAGSILSTPAVADGIIYAGGGYKSHAFYALNAKTGRPVWTYRTGDNGPSAPVVSEGYLLYSTESCTLYAHDAKTGKLQWSRWLSDPLIALPTISNGTVFVSYPTGKGAHVVAFRLKDAKVLWDQPIPGDALSAPIVAGDSVYGATATGSLFRFGAKDGRRHWIVAAGITSAPRIVGGRLLVSQRHVKTVEVQLGMNEVVRARTTVEGVNLADAATGKFSFDEPEAAEAAPHLQDLANNGRQYASNLHLAYRAQVSSRQLAARRALETVNGRGVGKSKRFTKLADALAQFIRDLPNKDAELLAKDAERAHAIARQITLIQVDPGPDSRRLGRDAMKRLIDAAAEMRDAAHKAEDAIRAAKRFTAYSRRFGLKPEAWKKPSRVNNAAKYNLSGRWAYQGSRPCIVGDTSINTAGGLLRACYSDTGNVRWEREIVCRVPAKRPLTPPALAGGKLYIGTADGRVICIDPGEGGVLWQAKVGGVLLTEPAVVGGNVYAASHDGFLICLETGDPTADGWPMWGGSPTHNGPGKKADTGREVAARLVRLP